MAIKKVKEFVLGLIHTSGGQRIGLRLYNVSSKKVTSIVVPDEGAYLNLTIKGKRWTPKYCTIADFPVFTVAGTDITDVSADVSGAHAWVLGQYKDGRLRLLSVTGQVKNVTRETALGFHKNYGIVGCTVTKKGELLPPKKSYVDVDSASAGSKGKSPDDTPPKKPYVKPEVTSSEKDSKKSKTTAKAAAKSAPKTTTKAPAKSGQKSAPKGTAKATKASTKKTSAKGTEKAASKKATKSPVKASKTKEATKVASAVSAKTAESDKSVVRNKVKTAPLSPITGKTFCIAGKVRFPGYTAGLRNYIISLGGQVAPKLSKDVDYVIVNDSKSAKRKEALKLGCQVITEARLFAMAVAKEEAM